MDQKLTSDKPILQRIPLKVFVRAGGVDAAGIAATIRTHLGEDSLGQELPEIRQKGAWTCYTFWAVLADDKLERTLREAIHKLPGVVMQL